jgi:hypothetical protein
LRKQIDFVFKEGKGLKEHKWPDVKVDDWPVKEIFRGKFLQEDEYIKILAAYTLNFVSLPFFI